MSSTEFHKIKSPEDNSDSANPVPRQLDGSQHESLPNKNTPDGSHEFVPNADVVDGVVVATPGSTAVRANTSEVVQPQSANPAPSEAITKEIPVVTSNTPRLVHESNNEPNHKTDILDSGQSPSQEQLFKRRKRKVQAVAGAALVGASSFLGIGVIKAASSPDSIAGSPERATTEEVPSVQDPNDTLDPATNSITIPGAPNANELDNPSAPNDKAPSRSAETDPTNTEAETQAPNNLDGPQPISAESYTDAESIAEAFINQGYKPWTDNGSDPFVIASFFGEDVEVGPTAMTEQYVASHKEEFANRMFVADWPSNPNLDVLASSLEGDNRIVLYNYAMTVTDENSGEDAGIPLYPEGLPFYQADSYVEQTTVLNKSADSITVQLVVPITDNSAETRLKNTSSSPVENAHNVWKPQLTFDKVNTKEGLVWKISDYHNFS